MKKLGMAVMVSLMATSAFAGGPIIVQDEPPVVVVPGPVPSSVGGLSGAGVAAGLGALLLLGLVLGGGGSSTTTTTTAAE